MAILSDMKRYLLISILLIALASCQKKQVQTTPWGTVIGADTTQSSATFSLGDIQDEGELIVLTISGPETYYDYHGHGMGLQYLLCEQFAKQIGVAVRVDVCRDTTEMLNRLRNGDADLIAFQLPKGIKGLDYCGAYDGKRGTQWAVRNGNSELADTLSRWFRPDMAQRVKREESFLLSSRSIERHVYSPMLDRAGGVISRYDRYFKMYAPVARWDWRLLAAQSYQESCFDPEAKSWAGARGLMQIMPSTADHLGLDASQLTNAEMNIAAATKYIAQLSGRFSDIGDPLERQNFVLASYNGGYWHIRDAMALARQHGRNPHSWAEVSEFVLKLSDPAYYRSAVVKNGYMRGSETVDYVNRIRQRYSQYRGVGGGGFTAPSGSMTPSRANKKYRFHV